MTPAEVVAEIIEVRKADHLKEFVMTRWLALCIAGFATAGGACEIAYPSIMASGSMGQIFPGWVRVVWSGLYFGGGLSILLALRYAVSHRDVAVRLDTAGSCALSSCWLVWCLAVFAARGWHSGISSASVFIALFVGFMGRAYLQVRSGSRPWLRRS